MCQSCLEKKARRGERGEILEKGVSRRRKINQKIGRVGGEGSEKKDVGDRRWLKEIRGRADMRGGKGSQCGKEIGQRNDGLGRGRIHRGRVFEITQKKSGRKRGEQDCEGGKK